LRGGAETRADAARHFNDKIGLCRALATGFNACFRVALQSRRNAPILAALVRLRAAGDTQHDALGKLCEGVLGAKYQQR